MSDVSWTEIGRRVHERADFCCEYCQTSQRVIGQAMHVEHIDPHGGDNLDNLCLSCSSCNLSKGVATSALDVESDQMVPLFNPRQQDWHEHFVWIEEGCVLQGLTATGRATIIRFKINRPRLIEARAIWVRAGVHPPDTASPPITTP